MPTTCFNCESACGLLAYVDRETGEIRKFEGNPEHPGSRGRNCAKGPATLNQIQDPGPHPLSAEARRRARRGQVAAGDLGRGARRHRRPDLAGDPRRPPERGHVPRRPAGRGRLHRARARGLGRRRPQLAHQRLLGRGARRLRALVRHRPPEPRPRERQGDLPGLVAPRGRALLQSARPAHHRGQEERRQADRRRHAAVEHRHPRRPLAGAAAGLGGGDPPRDRQLHHPGRSATTASSCAAGGTGRSTCAELHPEAAADVRDASKTLLAARVRGVHLRVRRRRVGRRRRRPSREVAELVAVGRHPPLDPHLAQRHRRQRGRLAGRAHALPAQRAARRGRHRGRHLPQRLEQVRAAADPPAAAASRQVERAQLAARVSARRCTRCRSCCRTSCSRGAASSTSTSPASTTRCGRTRTASAGSRC